MHRTTQHLVAPAMASGRATSQPKLCDIDPKARDMVRVNPFFFHLVSAHLSNVPLQSPRLDVRSLC